MKSSKDNTYTNKHTIAKKMNNNSLRGVVIVGRNNSQLYQRTFGGAAGDGGSADDLRYAFLAHTACDIIDERAAAAAQRSQNAPPQGTAAAAAAAAASGYLGLLQSVGDMSVHGLATATGVKILLLCAAADGSTPKDSDVRAALEFVHGCYAQLVCSPFHSHDEPQLIRSAR
ncbi:hypothetical protein GQ42DRAFT_164271, partial [Ramicandelaber brevisporus]